MVSTHRQPLSTAGCSSLSHYMLFFQDYDWRHYASKTDGDHNDLSLRTRLATATSTQPSGSIDMDNSLSGSTSMVGITVGVCVCVRTCMRVQYFCACVESVMIDFSTDTEWLDRAVQRGCSVWTIT